MMRSLRMSLEIVVGVLLSYLGISKTDIFDKICQGLFSYEVLGRISTCDMVNWLFAILGIVALVIFIDELLKSDRTF